MAKEVGLSQSAVSRIWRAFGLQPHRQEMWKLSKDPLFIDKVREVVGLYLNPPERAVVLCVDEKSQIQALYRTAPILPMLPGTPQRATHDDKRAGTSSLYAALDIATGKDIGALHSRHRAIDFKKFLQRIDREVPDDLDVHVVLENSSTHKTTAIQKWLAAHPPLSAALHADLGELAEPRRALVCRADAEAAAARRAPLGARAQHRQLTSTAARFPGTWSAIRWPKATVTTSSRSASRSPSTTSATARRRSSTARPSTGWPRRSSCRTSRRARRSSSRPAWRRGWSRTVARTASASASWSSRCAWAPTGPAAAVARPAARPPVRRRRPSDAAPAAGRRARVRIGSVAAPGNVRSDERSSDGDVAGIARVRTRVRRHHGDAGTAAPTRYRTDRSTGHTARGFGATSARRPLHPKR